MSGSLHLLDIDVRIRKYWENASKLPEKDWCFVISVWIVSEFMWEIMILVTFKKQSVVVFALQSTKHQETIMWDQ